ncbi:hydrolase [Candidatus Aerophobetes bacterium]|uniref:Hydrolase n=1 Tax=Aerophobetes bacterium TaxID=2030807 RepID=A0A2A4X606_UNCAE|nr:MAG: hydrolase [Candidatus Aerophobetes bacterium]
MFRFIKDKLAWLRFFKDDSLGRRLLVGFLILLSLFLFIHFREVSVEIPDVGTKATNYVVADVDFSFPDEEGSAILRRESSRDIGEIYRISPRVLQARSTEFQTFLIRDQSWRHLLSSTTFEQMYNASEYAKDFLLKLRFADSRSLNRLDSLDLGKKDYFLLPSSFNGETVRFPPGFWQDVEQRIIKKKRHEGAVIVYIINFFEDGRWPLDRDIALQKSLGEKVEKSMPGEWTKVEAGTRILEKGETVTRRHVVMLKAMKEALFASHKMFSFITICGSFFFALMVVVISAFYFYRQQKAFIESLSKLSLFATVLILVLVLSKVSEYFILAQHGFFGDLFRYPLFIPFIAILMTALLNAEIAFFTSAILAIVMGFTLAVDPFRFISINLLTGMSAVLLSGVLRKRKQVFSVCAKGWLLCIVVFICYNLDNNQLWSPFMVNDMVGTLLFMAITAILVVGILPILESLFRVMTDITLMEFMDPNNELLRRLSIEAPGTYQHCLVVGSIAEAAAQAIGANGLFCRVSTLYHDVGKLLNPHYFTENQMGGFNIHQLLTPAESAQVIISHVLEGEALAKKYSLPKSFIDVILEHHGSTLVYYFYCKQVDLMGGDESAVDEKAFRYPGPKPHSKESAIIMMADTVEAASRSLEDVNEKTLLELVDRLVGEKLEDGQFDECQLSFEEFGKIKRTMVKNLALARHVRIKYPEKKPKLEKA